ncbi:MAG: hypothetical protein RMJ98_09525 [Myxococcales bacterium]|nr:hypothetical protein [Polyangiaceae bacterium]MDW8249527.1 hypothetical protein [Myxococcales bacterium]
MAATLFKIASSFFWTLSGLLLLLGLLGAPFALYARYRRKYGQSPAFQLSWSESYKGAPFRESEQHVKQRLEVTGSAEYGAKLGFFLGILGFLWTPIVLVGGWAGFMPMVTVGLPGLVVSWSVFFAARSFLKNGPAAVPLMRSAALAEIAVNLWVVVLVALCTGYESIFTETQRRALAHVLLTRESDMTMYTLFYSLRRGGVLTVAYVAVSFLHAALLLRSLSPLERARELQTREA